MGLYSRRYRRKSGNRANHCTLNNRYEKTVVVEGNRDANTTELKIAKFNDNDVGNLLNQSGCRVDGLDIFP